MQDERSVMRMALPTAVDRVQLKATFSGCTAKCFDRSKSVASVTDSKKASKKPEKSTQKVNVFHQRLASLTYLRHGHDLYGILVDVFALVVKRDRRAAESVADQILKVDVGDDNLFDVGRPFRGDAVARE
jgi:hypothetical protein